VKFMVKFRAAARTAILGFGVCLATAGAHARADQTAATSGTTALKVDQKALDLIRETANRLASARSIAFRVKRAFEEPAANGQPLFYTILTDVALQRPDKLKVVTLADGPPSEFYYDGKEMAVFLPAANLVAIEAAPPKIEDLLETAYVKAGIYFPFVDFIVDDPYTAMTEKLTSAFVVGQSTVVGETTTNIVAIANPDFQAQIWIGAQDKLPRLVWINPTNSKTKPRSMLEFSNWRLGAQSSAKLFHSARAWSAPRMKFARPGAAHHAR
jgi:hypothetical protein